MNLTPCRKDRILVVDDDEPVRRILKQVLMADFPALAIDVATNGMEAMKLFHNEHHAVIVLDLFMPIMNGEQAYRGIERMCDKEQWAMPAVIFCTAHNPSSEVRRFVTSNPNHAALQKPVKNDVLIQTVRSRLAALESEPTPP